MFLLNVTQIYFNLCFVVTKRSVITEEMADTPQTPVNTEQCLESKTVDIIFMEPLESMRK